MPAIVLAYDGQKGGGGTRREMLINAQITAHSGHGRRQTRSEERGGRSDNNDDNCLNFGVNEHEHTLASTPRMAIYP